MRFVCIFFLPLSSSLSLSLFLFLCLHTHTYARLSLTQPCFFLLFFIAVRADRMRGGRNKFGPMYKRDRARKLQILRQRQLALQAIRGSISGTSSNTGSGSLNEGPQSQLSPSNFPPYANMHIKQEIQIPQVNFLPSIHRLLKIIFSCSPP